MKNFNICIDIDGTITDPYFWLNSANRYFHKNVTINEITDYKIYKAMGVTAEQYIEFYDKFKFKIHNEEENIREDAREIIKELIKNNSIYFVTAREKDLEILTHSYLKKHDIPYDNVFVLGTTYKVDIAKELNCDIFIEDSYENALQLSENDFKVLLIDTNYNRMPLNKNITRVSNWNEIDDIIKELILQSKAM